MDFTAEDNCCDLNDPLFAFADSVLSAAVFTLSAERTLSAKDQFCDLDELLFAFADSILSDKDDYCALDETLFALADITLSTGTPL